MTAGEFPARAVELLEEEKRLALSRMERLTGDFEGVVAASRDTNADDEHDPEGATIAFERSQIVALVKSAERHLREIEMALERVRAGTYGRCENCGDPIPPARLVARPVASRCVACASIGPA